MTLSPLFRPGRIAPASLRRAAAALVLLPALALTPRAALAAKNPKISMVIEKRGTVTIELFPKDAPKTVAHITDLVKKKFYDGILFHRVVYREGPDGKRSGFVAQAGDPASKKIKDGSPLADISDEEVAMKYRLGSGGSGKNVPLEVKRSHERGTMGMARSSDPDSGDSQFFINLNDNLQLDSGYCVFGKVTKGLDVVDKIRQGDRIKSIRLLPPGKGKK